MDSKPSETLNALTTLQSQSLSIIRLSEPISASQTSTRTSDVSNSAFENPSPASLEADLSHYKELFSKLRFSYLEQVTKEKFLRAIVGDPPLVVEHVENIELEAQLAEVKGVLKAQKENVAEVVRVLEGRGRDLARRYETISLQTTLLSNLPSQITELNTALSQLRATTPQPTPSHPSHNLPLPATQTLLSERQAELDDLDSQLKTLQQALPKKTRELERAEREARGLEEQRERVLGQARDAMRRRDEGSGADELEMRGRWLRGVENGLRGMLGVEA